MRAVGVVGHVHAVAVVRPDHYARGGGVGNVDVAVGSVPDNAVVGVLQIGVGLRAGREIGERGVQVAPRAVVAVHIVGEIRLHEAHRARGVLFSVRPVKTEHEIALGGLCNAASRGRLGGQLRLDQETVHRVRRPRNGVDELVLERLIGEVVLRFSGVLAAELGAVAEHLAADGDLDRGGLRPLKLKLHVGYGPVHVAAGERDAGERFVAVLENVGGRFIGIVERAERLHAAAAEALFHVSAHTVAAVDVLRALLVPEICPVIGGIGDEPRFKRALRRLPHGFGMLLFLQHDSVLLGFRGFFGVLVFLEARKRDPKDNERGKEDHRNDKNIRQQTLAEAAFFLSVFRNDLLVRGGIFRTGGAFAARAFRFLCGTLPTSRLLFRRGAFPTRGFVLLHGTLPTSRLLFRCGAFPTRGFVLLHGTLAADRLVLLRGTLAADRLTILRGTFPTDGFFLARRAFAAHRGRFLRGARCSPDGGGRLKALLRNGGGRFKALRGDRSGGLFRQRPRRVRSHALGSLRNIKEQLLLADGGSALGARQARFALPARAGYRFFMLSHSCPQFKMRMAVDIWRMPMMFEPRVICSPL